MIDFESFVGGDISAVLTHPVVKNWKYKTDVETDLSEPLTSYLFVSDGLEIECDASGIVNTVFLHSKEYGGIEQRHSRFDLSLGRDDIRKELGQPSRCAEPFEDSTFGQVNGWDRYDFEHRSIHFEYLPNNRGIEKVTIMRAEVVPS